MYDIASAFPLQHLQGSMQYLTAEGLFPLITRTLWLECQRTNRKRCFQMKQQVRYTLPWISNIHEQQMEMREPHVHPSQKIGTKCTLVPNIYQRTRS